MKRLLAIWVSLLLVLFALVSCSGSAYNAAILKEGVTHRAEWLEDNYTRGSYQSDYDDALPESRTYIVEDQDSLDGIFSAFPEINFDKETVIVYCYTTIYLREQRLEKVSVEEGVLSVEFDVVRGKPGAGDAAVPQTRLCVIRLDKADFTEAKITYNGQ